LNFFCNRQYAQPQWFTPKMLLYFPLFACTSYISDRRRRPHSRLNGSCVADVVACGCIVEQSARKTIYGAGDFGYIPAHNDQVDEWEDFDFGPGSRVSGLKRSRQYLCDQS
jgi:hypothetical protein